MNDLGWKRRFENKKIDMVEIINEQNHLMKRKDINGDLYKVLKNKYLWKYLYFQSLYKLD